MKGQMLARPCACCYCAVLILIVQAALEWCLLVQEALLWQDWPAAAVASAGTKTADPSAHSMAPAPQTPTRAVAATAAPAAGGSSKAAAAAVNGQGAPAAAAAAAAAADVDVSSSVLFGGPRLKMGVAAGAPQSVMPDHMGRADYHGNAVNMAAR
jgi:class 3 adenylate cyclase